LDASAPDNWRKRERIQNAFDNISAAGGALERKRLEYTELHRKLALCTLPLFMIFLASAWSARQKEQSHDRFLLAWRSTSSSIIPCPSWLARSQGAESSAPTRNCRSIAQRRVSDSGTRAVRMYERGTISALPW